MKQSYLFIFSLIWEPFALFGSQEEFFFKPKAVPPAHVYSHFLGKLMRHAGEVEESLERLVDEIRRLLPDFGQVLALDSKATKSLARGKKQKSTQEPDGRRDTDANFGKKTYRGLLS